MQGNVKVAYTGRGLQAMITGLGRSREAQFEAASALKRRLVSVLTTGSRSGKMYGNHQASAPGEPPIKYLGKSNGGHLHESIKIQTVNQYATAVYVKAEHAIYLEYGTKFIEPRPFMTMASTLAQKQMSRKIGNILHSYKIPFTITNRVGEGLEGMEE
jgi:hypothetical protein